MRRQLPLALAFALAAGCTMTEPDLSVLDRADLAQSHVAPAKGAQRAPPLATSKKLTVDEAVRIALVNNPEIGQAIARVRQAEANIKRARAAFLPSVDAQASWTKWYESNSGVSMPEGLFEMPAGANIVRNDRLYTGQIGASWNLFAGGRDLQNYRSARDARRARSLLSKRVGEVIDDAVRQAFYQALLARDAITIGEASVAFSSRELKDAKARYEVGRGLKTDVLTFETRRLAAQVGVTVAQNSHRLARIALSELMAIALGEDIELAMPAEAATRWEKMHPEQVAQQAFGSRADLAAARKSYAVAKRQVKAAQADFYPRLDASAAYGAKRQNSTHLRSQDDELTVGAAVSWNLYRGGDTVAAVAAARHAATETAEQFRQLKLRIRTQVGNALANIKTARERVGLAEKTVATAEETLRLLTERYRAGAITISQVTEGELRLTEARLDLIKAKIDLLTAQSELSLALGEKENAPGR